jgi:hypothetical protein
MFRDGGNSDQFVRNAGDTAASVSDEYFIPDVIVINFFSGGQWGDEGIRPGDFLDLDF